MSPARDDPIHPDPIPSPAPESPAPSTAPPASPAPGPPGPGQGRGKRGDRLVHHFKIDEMVAADDRTAYEALLLDPRQTLDSLLAWLHARGYVNISRGAVHRHRRHFEQDVKEIKRSAKIAAQFAALARAQGGAGGLADAGQFRFEQMFLERLFSMKPEDRLSGKEWTEFARAMTALLDNREKYESLRVEWQERAARAADAVERAAGKGKKFKVVNGVEIANTVRRILGVPLPGEPLPDYAMPGRGPIEEPPGDESRSIAIANDVRGRLGMPPVDEPGEQGRGLPAPSEN